MGTSRSAVQLGRKFDRAAKELRDQRGALNRAGMAGKRIVESAAASAGVLGTRAVGKRKVITAFYDITPDGRAVLIGLRGPAHLVANPTRPHRIEPRRPRGSRTRRRGQQALTINGAVRAGANHPGTKGNPFFRRARKIAERQLPAVYARAQITEPLRKVFQ